MKLAGVAKCIAHHKDVLTKCFCICQIAILAGHTAWQTVVACIGWTVCAQLRQQSALQADNWVKLCREWPADDACSDAMCAVIAHE